MIETLIAEVPLCFILGAVFTAFGQIVRNALGRG